MVLSFLNFKFKSSNFSIGEYIKEGHATTGQTQQAIIEETSVNLEPGNAEEENEYQTC